MPSAGVTDPSPNPFALARKLAGLHLIDGRSIPGHAGKVFPVLNPAPGAINMA
jgi:hypothetical protein